MPRSNFPIKTRVNVVETTKINEMVDAPTYDIARAEFYRLFYSAKATVIKAQNLGSQLPLFFVLANSPKNPKSFTHTLHAWKALEPLYASKKINNPMLTEVSAKFAPVMQEYKNVYRDIESEFLLDENLTELEELAENVMTPVSEYLNSNQLFKFKNLPKQHQLEWSKLVDTTQTWIQIYRQFIINRKLTYRLVDMLKQSSAMEQSTAQGTFRYSWYPEKVTILKNGAEGKTQEIQGYITEYEQNKKPDSDLQFVATPTTKQIVEVNYDFTLRAMNRWGHARSRGKLLEEYIEDETSTVRHIKQIQILEITPDPTCRPRQIVDIAAKYLLNCRKNIQGKPLLPIELSGPHQLALKAALLNMGVGETAIVCKNPEENQWPEKEIGFVKQVAKQRFKEIERLVNPCSQGFWERRLPLTKQLDRHSDAAMFGSNEKFEQLQQDTLSMLENMKNRFPDEFVSPEMAKPDDVQNAEMSGGLKLRAI